MVKCQPIREIIRELNTTYFQDKPITLDISLFVLGPAGENVRLVVDRIGYGKMTEDLKEMNGEYLGKKRYYSQYILQYGDYYSVEADDACEIEIWRERERAGQ